MEVAILRECVPALCKGDFGLTGVVIGYTYKCLFLALAHVPFKAPAARLPIPVFLFNADPPNVITFPTWVKDKATEQWSKNK